MKILLIRTFIVLGLLNPFGWFAQLGDSPQINTPLAGQALQGQVQIRGSVDLEGFQSAEVSFSYASTGEANWFLIAQLTQPVKDDLLATWDTTSIADGAYALRVVVYLNDGTSVEQKVKGLRVRNYSPIETETPHPIDTTDLPSPAATITVTARPATPTALPNNPVQVTRQQLRTSLVSGGMLALAAFAALGLYMAGGSVFRKK